MDNGYHQIVQFQQLKLYFTQLAVVYGSNVNILLIRQADYVIRIGEVIIPIIQLEEQEK